MYIIFIRGERERERERERESYELLLSQPAPKLEYLNNILPTKNFQSAQIDADLKC